MHKLSLRFGLGRIACLNYLLEIGVFLMKLNVNSSARSLLPFCLTLLPIALIGCGGSNGNGTGSATVLPKLIINWLPQTRAVTAPTYAVSAIISIQPSTVSTPTTWIVDRPSDNSTNMSFPTTGPAVLRTVPAVLKIDFKSHAGGQGITVASAAASITIAADGTLMNSVGRPLGTITYSSTVAGITFETPDLGVGQVVPVTVSGLTPNGLVALPQDLVDLEITDGSENASVGNGNNLQGLQVGRVTLTARFETYSRRIGFDIAPRTATYSRFVFVPEQMVWDSTRNKFWATLGSDSNTPNSIVDFDPTTGQTGTPISVGDNPQEIDVSADGTKAYVGLNGSNQVQVVDLTARTLGTTYEWPFYPGAVASSIKVNPTNANEVSICLVASPGQNPMGPIVYRNGVVVGTPPALNSATKSAWVSGTRLVTVTSGAFLGLSDVGASSVDTVLTTPVDRSFTGGLYITDTKVVNDIGVAYSTDTLQKLGKVSFGAENFDHTGVDPATGFAWATVSRSRPLKIRSFNLANFNAFDVVTLPITSQLEGVKFVKPFGTATILIVTNQASYFVNYSPTF